MTPTTQRRLRTLERALYDGADLPVLGGGHPLWVYAPRYHAWLRRRRGRPRYGFTSLIPNGAVYQRSLVHTANRDPERFRLASVGLAFENLARCSTSGAASGDTTSLAIFSRGRRHYRYWLSRQWYHRPPLIVVMLNPSTADAFANDPTVARVEKLARRLGYGGYIVLNVAAWRATKPDALAHVEDPLGPYNHQMLEHTLREVERRWCTTPDVLLAYGNNASRFPLLKQRVTSVLRACEHSARVLYLERNKNGSPKHPLYIKGDQPLQRWPSEQRPRPVLGQKRRARAT